MLQLTILKLLIRVVLIFVESISMSEVIYNILWYLEQVSIIFKWSKDIAQAVVLHYNSMLETLNKYTSHDNIVAIKNK